MKFIRLCGSIQDRYITEQCTKGGKALDQNELMNIVRTEVILAVGKALGKRFIPAAVSNRHVHLCRADIDKLFGVGYELTPLKPLSQPGQYAAKETITLEGPKGSVSGIRVLGPARPETQIEISVTDSFKLGIKPVVRMSGKLDGSPGGVLTTPQGRAEINKGVVVSARHIHLSARQAEALQLTDGQVVGLRSTGERSIVLENVLVRSGEGHHFEVHLDMDEANAAMIGNGDLLEIVEECKAQQIPAQVKTAANVLPVQPAVANDEPLSLITEEEVKQAAKCGQSMVKAAQRAIITPLARDTARELGISIERG